MACELSSVRSHAFEAKASSYHEATSLSQTQQVSPTPPAPAIQLAPPTSATPLIQYAPAIQPQGYVVSQLFPTLISIQQVLR